MPKIFISTIPFGQIDPKPIELLEETGWDFQINSLGRKLKPEEVGEFAKDCDGLIAGTENIHIVLQKARQLKMVARVGIGLDSVPLEDCKKKGVVVTYTPDAVTMAVAELTIGLMISMTRHVVQADIQMRRGEWNRIQGRRLEESVIGLIGFGRIGSNVARLLTPFKPRKVLVNDLKDKDAVIRHFRQEGLSIEQVSKEEIYNKAHVISLHVPLSGKTRDLITQDIFQQCRNDVFLINTARGGIVNEAALYNVLKEKRIAGAAVDVFSEEPYTGPLSELDNVILTQHMGSCSFDCRQQMEVQAVEDTIRFFKGETLLNEVPDEEYMYQKD